MLEQVVKTISRYNMLPSGTRVIAAVSGGADSVCLLHVLVERAQEVDLRVEVAHYNHRWRGEESDADERFVRELAEKFSLRFHLARAEGRAAKSDMEQSARRARMAFFGSLNQDGARIATGHTRDDQAETVLLRLLRGSGFAGLAGILPVTKTGSIRPLLDVTRQQVLQYLGERNIPWREDSTNRDLKFARNRVRHELLPQLKTAWNPRLTDALAHLADLSYQEEMWWGSPESPLETIEYVRCAGGIQLNAGALTALPCAVARRAVRMAIAGAKGNLRQIEFDHVERVLELAARQAGEGRIALPGLEVRRSFDWIWFPLPFAVSKIDPVALSIPGYYASPDGKSTLRLEVEQASPHEKTSGEEQVYLRHLGAPGARRACATLRTAVLGLNRIPGELQLRGWRPGDRYRPTGDTRVRKVAEMFAEARIPSWQRRQWPIIMSGTGIVWARQFGAGAEFAADREADRVLRISEEILSN